MIKLNGKNVTMQEAITVLQMKLSFYHAMKDSLPSIERIDLTESIIDLTSAIFDVAYEQKKKHPNYKLPL